MVGQGDVRGDEVRAVGAGLGGGGPSEEPGRGGVGGAGRAALVGVAVVGTVAASVAAAVPADDGGVVPAPRGDEVVLRADAWQRGATGTHDRTSGDGA